MTTKARDVVTDVLACLAFGALVWIALCLS